MGIHDRDWYHEDRDKREKMPHPGQHKPRDPQVLLNTVSTLPDLTKSSFLTGFFVGVILSISMFLIIYLF